ncbi:hypothetical protein OAR37_02675 [Flavobacteriaceae bacterium]|uniref:hypothetical protein n=1 Tax=Candidatus Arcticimaribacter forsetii TaxID=2820661 RepID=UPI0020779182|nr:hypothetical protein [Candidatus Arcticimaribacter forsetii]MDB2325457.1 hypothetical protein [Flavobacteriaceae bacterium]MDB4751731.1 hypothetical protein [Flavobacteriaceae bacterium]MDC0960318.1 hypothetical protein [Flavobacteriaceae bacterium]
MTNDQKENLFVLIKSLSKSEKRQFKLYVGRMDSNQDSKFLILFNLLDKMDVYDEKIILKKGFVSKQQLSNLKAHLYKQVLVSLRINPSQRNKRMLIREQLDFATVLYQKGLYNQSLKILDRAKAIAVKLDEKYAAFEIVELEKVIESQYITRSMSNRAQELVRDATYFNNHNHISSQLSNLSLQLYERLIKTGYTKSDQEYKEVTEFFNDRLPDLNFEDLGFREKLWFFKAHVWYSLLTQDFLSSYRYSAKWVALFDNNPDMISSHPVFYLQGNNYLLESTALIKYPIKFKEILNKMLQIINSEHFPKNDNLSSLAFLYEYNNLFNFYFLEGKFIEGQDIIAPLLVKIEFYKNQIDEHHIMMFYYKIACLYFGSNDFENAIIYLNKIVENKKLKMREDLLCFTRLLNLIAHYEAGNDYHIDEHIRDTYKFLLKMGELHEVQKSLIRFVRKLGSIYPSELKEAFKDLHKELKQYEQDPYERRAFLYLDILSWLESKIENKTVAEIIHSKANIINRKDKHPTESL